MVNNFDFVAELPSVISGPLHLLPEQDLAIKVLVEEGLRRTTHIPNIYFYQSTTSLAVNEVIMQLRQRLTGYNGEHRIYFERKLNEIEVGHKQNLGYGINALI